MVIELLKINACTCSSIKNLITVYCFKDIMVGGLVKKRMELQDFLKGPKPKKLMMMTIKVSYKCVYCFVKCAR